MVCLIERARRRKCRRTSRLTSARLAQLHDLELSKSLVSGMSAFRGHCEAIVSASSLMGLSSLEMVSAGRKLRKNRGVVGAAVQGRRRGQMELAVERAVKLAEEWRARAVGFTQNLSSARRMVVARGAPQNGKKGRQGESRVVQWAKVSW